MTFFRHKATVKNWESGFGGFQAQVPKPWWSNVKSEFNIVHYSIFYIWCGIPFPLTLGHTTTIESLRGERKIGRRWELQGWPCRDLLYSEEREDMLDTIRDLRKEVKLLGYEQLLPLLPRLASSEGVFSVFVIGLAVFEVFFCSWRRRWVLLVQWKQWVPFFAHQIPVILRQRCLRGFEQQKVVAVPSAISLIWYNLQSSVPGPCFNTFRSRETVQTCPLDGLAGGIVV